MTLSAFIRRYGLAEPYSEFRKIGRNISEDHYVPKSWDSESKVFDALIDEIKPATIIELGSWKGASALYMARRALLHRRKITMLCVDTWLASNPALWRTRNFRNKVTTFEATESQYGQFLQNMIHAKLDDQVFAFRNTSTLALRLLKDAKLEVDLVYIDAGHTEVETAADLVGTWPLIRRGGVIVGDDYGKLFPGVARAVHTFEKTHEVKAEIKGQKWWIRKPTKNASPWNPRAQLQAE